MATSLTELTGAKKDEMITSLASLVVADAGAEVSEESISAVIEAAGCTSNATYVKIFATVVAAGGIDKFCATPGSGGGGGGGGDAAAAEEVEEEKEEEEEMDMGGAMDMFGGEGGDGDY
eukprot:CAMPEP_0118650074 /NCGR_PEP_ID=MMETSP0785-20121206/10050_1 /TAXON_ID=91992 /ORGANISM="Bolidomonas pacifica, Strain CCMP 1866" /LENGTH=118 /DNA_ID=CAMNT_0006542419 /DNA_START=12 /DNA_END=368 /DNA_ORIENTATION=+